MATRRGCHVALQNFTRFGAGLPTALRKEGFVQDSEEPTRIRQPCNTIIRTGIYSSFILPSASVPFIDTTS